MANDLATRLPSKSLVACAAIVIAGAGLPSVASGQDIVTEALTVPFAIAPAPFVSEGVIVGDPYYRYPAYRYSYAPAYYDYPQTYGMVCGYDPWSRWVCYPR